MFDRLKAKLSFGQNKAKGIEWQNGERPGVVGAIPFRSCSNSQSYDNAFPDIARIAEAFAEVMPYAIDVKGVRLPKQPQLIKALYNPNEEMSGPEFFETLITMLLVHPLVHILVWHYENGEAVAGGPITPENIAGFTFLEKAVMSKIDGHITFREGSRTWTRKDVMTLSLNVNPYQILAGYSPSQAIRKWATVDDCIAEYQAGQFENGGVPAGVMTITAPTVEAYNKAVDRIIAAHTGPSNANRVIYVHRPTSSLDGKPVNSGVEWSPFAQTNKDMTLDALFNQANKKIDMNFGVPEEIKGYLQNSNYASAEVADYMFSRRILYPKLVKVYSKITHEMNRMTGGLGFALSFDYELPVLTDTRKVQTETLIDLLDSGFTVESCVEALRLPKSFLKLNKVDNNREEVLQVEESTDDKPSQSEDTKSVVPQTCEHCGHHSKMIETWEGVVNPTLKQVIGTYLLHFYNKIKQDSDVKNVSEAIDSARSKVKTDSSAQTLRTLAIGCIYYQLALNENESSKRFAAQYQMESPTSVMDDDKLREFNLQLQSAVAQAAMLVESGEDLDNLNLDEVSKTVVYLTEALATHDIHAAISDFADGRNYEEQLNYLLVKFADDNLTIWADESAQTSTTVEALAIISQTMANKEYRVNRWVLTEQHRGEELGKLLSLEETAETLDLVPYKIWRTREGACEHCLALEGEKVEATKTFSNGNMVPSDHPNCRCDFDVVLEKGIEPVKVCCPHCKRYMFESTGGIVENVICANSKCKRHYDIEIADNKVIAKERAKDEH